MSCWLKSGNAAEIFVQTDFLRFRVVGVHVTQFKHQLTLQDQLEVKIKNKNNNKLF